MIKTSIMNLTDVGIDFYDKRLDPVASSSPVSAHIEELGPKGLICRKTAHMSKVATMPSVFRAGRRKHGGLAL